MVSGMKTTVVGEANDYVGKGMAGGDIAIMPPTDSGFKAEDASIVGNTCLYGATGGRLFVNGKAGQFACVLQVLPFLSKAGKVACARHFQSLGGRRVFSL